MSKKTRKICWNSYWFPKNIYKGAFKSSSCEFSCKS